MKQFKLILLGSLALTLMSSASAFAAESNTPRDHDLNWRR